MQTNQVAIIGAGITGLVCAVHLQRAGISFDIFEAQDRVGGRVRTEKLNGFTLDVGLQVFLEAYKEFDTLLDYKALELGYFDSAAFLACNGKMLSFINPLLHPLEGLSALLEPWATLKDKALLGAVFIDSLSAKPTHVSGVSTMQYLKNRGFSATIITRLFVPFFGDIFLDRTLSPDSSFFLNLFKSFTFYRACLPAAGMEAIPAQIAATLPQAHIHLHTEVDSYTLAQEFAWVVDTRPAAGQEHYFGTEILYFTASAADVSAFPARLFVQTGPGYVLSAAVPSAIQPAYAPVGSVLMSITLSPQARSLGDEKASHNALAEVTPWLAKYSQAAQWHYLARYKVPMSLPSTTASSPATGFAQAGNVLQGGDAFAYPSLNGAAYSGRKMAEHIAKASLVK